MPLCHGATRGRGSPSLPPAWEPGAVHYRAGPRGSGYAPFRVAAGGVCLSLQSPGQYYFKPMMKEFRFEPSSQMIEVQEGQNLKITITGYRTAYR